MLNEQSLQQYLARHQLPPEAQAYIRRVRGSEPSRAVAGGKRNVTCRFPSRKMGRTIQAESHTDELPTLWLWEYDADTYEFWDQPEARPLPIVTRDGRKTRQLKTADFLVLQADFVGWVECKTTQWLEDKVKSGDVNFQRDAEGRWHYLPGEAEAAQWGMRYLVRVLEDNNPNLVSNLMFLADYLLAGVKPIEPAARENILSLLDKSGAIRLCDLVRTPGVIADDVYKLVSQRDLYADLERDRLSEIERTHVFRDRDAAMAHRLLTSSLPANLMPDLSVVDLSPGSKISWDGRIWDIVNDGQTGYFLVAGDRHVELSRELMQRLIGEGKVLADPAAPEARSQRAAARLAEADNAQRAEAVARYNALFPEEGVAVITPRRTLTFWRGLWKQGEELYGRGFIGLLPDIHKRGNRLPKLPEATLKVIHKVIEESYLGPKGLSLKHCWGLARLECKTIGTVPPSESTFLRIVNASTTEEDRARAREGEKAAYQVGTWYWELGFDTPRHGQRPMEIAHLDHTEIDLQLVDERFQRKTRKCWVSALIDAYSRMVLATFITFDAPSYRSCMMVIRECVRRHGRVPSMIVVDNGSDFKSKYFEQLLAFLQVTKKHRPKSAARHGNVIERLFKRFNEDYVHTLEGNNKPLQKPRGMSKSHDPREHAVWTIGTFTERFNEYLDTVYAVNPHETLGVAPQQAFDLGLRDFGERANRRIACDEAFRMMCLPSTRSGTAHVRSAGVVKINYLLYHDKVLASPGVIGTDVEVKYDPFNMSLAYAYVNKRWVELKSSHSRVFSRYSEREIEAASQEIREKNQGTYGRRQDMAEVLARFLQATEEKEAALAANNVIRQAQMRSAEKAPAQAGSSEEATQWDESFPKGDDFADLPIEDYGEF